MPNNHTLLVDPEYKIVSNFISVNDSGLDKYNIHNFKNTIEFNSKSHINSEKSNIRYELTDMELYQQIENSKEIKNVYYKLYSNFSELCYEPIENQFFLRPFFTFSIKDKDTGENINIFKMSPETDYYLNITLSITKYYDFIKNSINIIDQKQDTEYINIYNKTILEEPQNNTIRFDFIMRQAYIGPQVINIFVEPKISNDLNITTLFIQSR